MNHLWLWMVLGFFLAFPVVVTFWPRGLLHYIRMWRLRHRIQEASYPKPPTDDELTEWARGLNG